MTLCYWREYRTYLHIGTSYGYSESQTFKIIRLVEDTLIKSGSFTVPGKKKLYELDGQVVILMDVTESPIERPQKKQRKYYSGKKKRHTFKTQLVVNKNSHEIVAVEIRNGKVHDFRIFKESGVHIPAANSVIVDSGYQGSQKIHANTQLPKKKKKSKN
jgi:hypothetical protein